MKKILGIAVALVASLVTGCTTPAKAHYEADKKFLDAEVVEYLKYVDTDPKLDADSKKARHADVDIFRTEVEHGLSGAK